jgi:hypothetical protein
MTGNDTYYPRKALWKTFPEMRKLSVEYDKRIEAAEAELRDRELAGEDTSAARTVMYEARWRVGCTNDPIAARHALERLMAVLKKKDAPGATAQAPDGSFAPCTDVFYLKLDRSTDQLLARQWPWTYRPSFLDRIDDPTRMYTYLRDLSWCDVERRGEDTRKELNLAISVIARLVLQGGQCGYLGDPQFMPVFEAFIRDWQDPSTGFFGVTYLRENGEVYRTRDLSLTFHIGRYCPHLIGDWKTLVATLFDIGGGDYPEGWGQGADRNDHNNYDVAELFHLGWPRMSAAQRREATAAINEMLDFCLESSVMRDGKLRDPDKGDMACDSYYFAAAFLDTIGYFDKCKRFWTDRDFPKAERLRLGMIDAMDVFDPHITMVADTLERLGAGRRPFSNVLL